jgi:hypothetical protein
MTSFCVVYDACVLYPAALRDLLIELARTGLFRAKWTARIQQEWIDGLLRRRPELPRDRLEHVARLMEVAVPDCIVTGFELLEAGLQGLPDSEDRHVLAAAIHAGAQEIVTINLKDFPEPTLRPYGISAVHPDEFVEHLLDLNAEVVCGCVRAIRARLSRPLHTAEQLLARYEQQGLAVSASVLRERISSL